MTDNEDGGGRQPLAWLRNVTAHLPGGELANPGIDAIERAVAQVEPLVRLGISELEQRVPPLAWARDQRQKVEREALRRLNARIGEAVASDPTVAPTSRTTTTSAAMSGSTAADAAEEASSAELLGRLLETGLRQTQPQAQEAMLRRIVKELVPDEAKLLTAMVGETGQAMIHVNIGRQRIFSYVTAAARAGNIKSRDLAHRYINHLIALGLVEVGPEDGSIPMEYDMLENELFVREALEGTAGPRLTGRARIERGTVRLTGLGQTLWASYSGDEPAQARPSSTTEESP